MVNLLVMFGLDYLQELVGEITFFERLPSIMQAWRRREPSVGAVDVVRLSDLLSVSSVVIQDLLTSLAFHLSRKSPRYETRTAHSVSSHEQDPKPLLIRKPRGHHAIEFLSDTLSAGLLEHICDTLDNVMDFDESRRRDHRGHTDFDMDRTHFTIKEVEALQVQLQATEDDGEQRALEEDLTGQILWFYRCGILSEVDHILARVVYYIQDNRYTSNEYDYRGLFKTTEIIKRTSHVGTDDDIAHLRRIMFDAGAGVSRHKLWLAARAAGRTGDVMEVYTEMSPAGSSTTDSPSAGLENDTTGIAEAGNYTDTPSFERPDHRTMPIRVARDNVLPQ
ncbi:hypothetical protein PISMIDRAFT_404570 [Pisolithus microcarpus 441]|uniref:Uncharacterized protein n=1 Tax=Pisolithus microcarpus 441 TaxID=765257 RepID=A0A0C9XM76_9AGAM|nr:hypothetical protein BKA83DRAFT_404570 [Pisolithus microcarpus]KIK13450.1 hypothetical protein PISMIDRAFT_404570 [Pisolithus microcarpus 441]